MIRHLVAFAVVALLGSSVLSTEASAGHKKKCKAQPVAYAAPCPPPAPVCVPAPAPVCEPVVCEAPKAKKKCGLFGGGKAKKAKHVAVAYAAPAPCATPVTYAAPAPVYATQQAHPSGQSY